MKVYQKLAALIEKCEQGNKRTGRFVNHEEIEEFIDEYFPSGSGFNNGCQIDLLKSQKNKICIDFSFHHIDEYGQYRKWTDHTIKIVPDLIHGFDFVITGENYNQIKEYFEDVFVECLRRDI